MKYVDWSHFDKYCPEQWIEMHTVHLTAEEHDKVLLSCNDASACWRRNGGQWQRNNGSDYRIFRPEVNDWVRAHAGHSYQENWCCDRYYYPDEERPELPRGGGWAWRQAGFKTHGYDEWGWQLSNSNEPRHRTCVMFKDKAVLTLFTLMWL